MRAPQRRCCSCPLGRTTHADPVAGGGAARAHTGLSCVAGAHTDANSAARGRGHMPCAMHATGSNGHARARRTQWRTHRSVLWAMPRYPGTRCVRQARAGNTDLLGCCPSTSADLSPTWRGMRHITRYSIVARDCSCSVGTPGCARPPDAIVVFMRVATSWQTSPARPLIGELARDMDMMCGAARFPLRAHGNTP